MYKKDLIRSSVLLGAFALAGVTLVATTHYMTEPLIAHNEHVSMLQRLFALTPAGSVDNDMVNDVLEVQDTILLGADTNLVYRGRKKHQPAVAVINTVIPNGYSGPIQLLVAVQHNGTLGGVRVVSHKETPGLGDKIEANKDDWILGFTGKSLQNPPKDEWAVKRDHGDFDQLTGATITSRAVVRAVRDTLIFAEQQGDNLYATPPATSTTSSISTTATNH